jgi:RNA polymerase sigma-70 factor, ECF subfamily
MLSDEDLARRRDFESLYARWRVALWQFLRRRTNDAARAEDLFQAVFLKVFRGLDTFRGDASFKTWLFTIAHRTVIDDRRADVAHAELPDVEAPAPPDTGDRAETLDAVKRALDALSPAHRTLFLLVRYHGMRIAEAGEVVGLTPGSAKVTLLRAQRRVGQFLAGKVSV